MRIHTIFMTCAIILFLQACDTQSSKKVTFKSGFEMTIPQNWEVKKSTHLGAKSGDLDLTIPDANLKIKFGVFDVAKMSAEDVRKVAKKEVDSFSQDNMAQSTKIAGKMPLVSYEVVKIYGDVEVVMNLIVVEATQQTMLVSIRGLKKDRDKYRGDIKKMIAGISYQK